MKTLLSSVLVVVLFSLNPVLSQEKVRIIPQPANISQKNSVFQLDRQLKLHVNDMRLFALVNYIDTQAVQEDLGGVFVVSKSEDAQLRLKLDSGRQDVKGGYALKVDKKGVTVRSSNETGLFYGLQSFFQLIGTDGSLPFVTINDAPRFAWRAFMLDEGRYFKGAEQVKKLLDEMARLKMNVFHWHLVDDQGWRIEIKKYPLLTEIGSTRPSTQVGPDQWRSEIQSGVPHEGYYTQEEIKEIVKYAAERHITIVPEIEMPGHSSAAIAAYPWLGSSGKKIEVPIKFGVSEDIYKVSDPKVYNFLTDVLDEVIALFPSEVVHIGGDEAKYDHWENSAEIKAYMKENGLKTFADLQVAFTNRISKYLEGKGKRMMGWNEIMGQNIHDYQYKKDDGAEEELAKGTVVHFWKGNIKLMTQAAEEGYDIVNSANWATYLDYPYVSISLKKAYDFNPIPEKLDTKYHNRIKGLGCQMWGEWIPTSGYMDYMVFPRIAAYAEVGWTPKKQKDFDGFVAELPKFMELWKSKGIYPAPLSKANRK
ncbi:beta-N-acetylhexosaminidase [Sediminicola luteus]|uniref:beta-N-acetylhexosaminidase n=1 Tax=Sediminicola luteus TaxID=319238 RepID=A0A2A4GBA2_9FLAO|nr:beta-N-acetylhexosaminidase [Sediminicola luteus]PCE65032.1 glycoside hydrolase family 20 [Sediminicola luteus]